MPNFFNLHAHHWDALYCEQDSNRLSEMAESLNFTEGDTVLDIGSGTGIFLPYLWQQVGNSGQIIALDYACAMLQYAKKKNLPEKTEFLAARVEDIPLQSNIFDAAVCYSCFPHFKDKCASLKEIHRVLKPGGRLYICHTSSRLEINSMHSSLLPVSNDLLPDESKMWSYLEGAQFTNIFIRDGAENYLSVAYKQPC